MGALLGGQGPGRQVASSEGMDNPAGPVHFRPFSQPERAWRWVSRGEEDFTAVVKGGGRQAGGRWLSRNPRSRFNNLFQN